MEFKFLLNLCRHQRILWDLSDPSYKNRQERGECTSLNCQCLVGAAGWSHFVYIKYQSDQRQLCDVGLRQAGKAILRMAFSWGSQPVTSCLLLLLIFTEQLTELPAFMLWLWFITPESMVLCHYAHVEIFTPITVIMQFTYSWVWTSTTTSYSWLKMGGRWVPMSYHLLTTLSPPEWLH